MAPAAGVARAKPADAPARVAGGATAPRSAAERAAATSPEPFYFTPFAASAASRAACIAPQSKGDKPEFLKSITKVGVPLGL